MKIIVYKILNRIIPKYGKYAKIVFLNKLRRLTNQQVENKYLFILSPPYCGSTLLNEVISTSPNVSVNNSFHTREGQALPTVRKMMFDHKRQWDPTLYFDWNYIKKEWRKYWDIRKAILLEKSPPNISRVQSINEVFPNSYYIIFFRNPYAQCESLIRRNILNVTAAAEFSLRCLEYQRKNTLMNLNSISISYEDLTSQPEEFKDKINEFIPELKNLKLDAKFSAHNFKNKKMVIQNLNKEKINNLSQMQLDEINEVFYEKQELLDFFGYEVIR